MALLDMRTALKDDLHCIGAGLDYGTTLRLPGEIFSRTSSTITPDQSSYVANLKWSIQQLRAVPVRVQPHRKVNIH